MADRRCFIQFPHPGGEHQPDPGGGRAWNTYSYAHARKFMQTPGTWTDEHGHQHSGDLWAWGEWEAQSELLQELDQPDSWGQPRYLWLPYYTDQPDGYERLHNTDPFIFGDRFLYSNCKQARRPSLKRLDQGSVIAFGSKKKHSWVLDTVLVISDFVDYLAAETHAVLAGQVPSAFLHVTGGRWPTTMLPRRSDSTEELRLTILSTACSASSPQYTQTAMSGSSAQASNSPPPASQRSWHRDTREQTTSPQKRWPNSGSPSLDKYSTQAFSSAHTQNFQNSANPDTSVMQSSTAKQPLPQQQPTSSANRGEDRRATSKPTAQYRPSPGIPPPGAVPCRGVEPRLRGRAGR